jgi:ribosome-binding factor A
MVGTSVSPQRKYPRTARVNEVMLEVLADELERMSDPRLELVTLTGVDVTRDLAYATVYYSTLAAVAADAPAGLAENAGDALRAASPRLQGLVGRQMRIRQVPKLTFKADPGIIAGQRIEEILRDIHHEADTQEQADGQQRDDEGDERDR